MYHFSTGFCSNFSFHSRPRIWKCNHTNSFSSFHMCVQPKTCSTSLKAYEVCTFPFLMLILRDTIKVFVFQLIWRFLETRSYTRYWNINLKDLKMTKMVFHMRNGIYMKGSTCQWSSQLNIYFNLICKKIRWLISSIHCPKLL